MRRSLLVTLFLALSGLALTAQAASTRPRNWGVPDTRRPINRIVIHHTAGNERSVSAIREGHLRRNFQDVAYHYAVFSDGRIESGRDVTKEGAGVWGRHQGMVEIVLVGRLHVDPPTRKQWEAAAQLAARWCLRYRLRPEQVQGHQEVAAPGHGTLCPGLNPTAFRKQVVREMSVLVRSTALTRKIAR